jgi:hypothetical protein
MVACQAYTQKLSKIGPNKRPRIATVLLFRRGAFTQITADDQRPHCGENCFTIDSCFWSAIGGTRPSAAGDERQHCGSYPLPDRPFAATGTELPYARSNTMSHSYFKTPASDDSTRLHIVKAGSRDRARIVEIRTSFSLRASPGKYICATRR